MHEKYMERCFELALKGSGNTAPNPLVGAVIVYQNKIIGEGFHSIYGGNHAEVEAVNSVQNKELLKESALYVNLEPCNHTGKTPPCTELILHHEIPHVIICNIDPNVKVAGKGILRLRENGVSVETGILQDKGAHINRRFFTFHLKKRPYVILKWAQTKDGFIDRIRKDNSPAIHKISNEHSHQLNHKWRTEESAILIGKNTALNDDPSLTARLWNGKNPTRIVLDKKLEIPSTNKLYDGNSPTIILNSKKENKTGNIYFHQLKEEEFNISSILEFLHSQNILSLIVEGGTKTIQQFIDQNLWDETRIFISPSTFGEGLKAPQLAILPNEKTDVSGDELQICFNK